MPALAKCEKLLRRGARALVVGAAVALLFGSWGCSSPALRGEPFPDDEAFRWSGRQRPTDAATDPFGFSNKARQIEGDLGVR